MCQLWGSLAVAGTFGEDRIRRDASKALFQYTRDRHTLQRGRQRHFPLFAYPRAVSRDDAMKPLPPLEPLPSLWGAKRKKRVLGWATLLAVCAPLASASCTALGARYLMRLGPTWKEPSGAGNDRYTAAR